MNRETFEKIVRAKLVERGVTNVDAKEIESAVKRANDVHVQMSERLQQDLTRLFDLSVQGVPFSKILPVALITPLVSNVPNEPVDVDEPLTLPDT